MRRVGVSTIRYSELVSFQETLSLSFDKVLTWATILELPASIFIEQTKKLENHSVLQKRKTTDCKGGQ